jgi:hypothetical protein
MMNRQSGQAATETIFLMPVLLGIFIAAIELCFMWVERHSLKLAAFEVGRYLQAETMLSKTSCIKDKNLAERKELRAIVMRRVTPVLTGPLNEMSMSHVAKIVASALTIEIFCSEHDGEQEISVSMMRPFRMPGVSTLIGQYSVPFGGVDQVCHRMNDLPPVMNGSNLNCMSLSQNIASLREFSKIKAKVQVQSSLDSLRHTGRTWQTNLFGIAKIDASQTEMFMKFLKAMTAGSDQSYSSRRPINEVVMP